MKTIITILLFLFMAVSVSAQVTINPGDTHIPPSVSCTDCPTPPACDSCCPACPPNPNPNVKVVDPLGSGDYLTVKDAVAASQAGWIILVKNGTYNREVVFSTPGSAIQPITLMPYPGHSPKFDFTGSIDTYPRITIDAEYVTVQGFEITNGHDGIKIYKGHATIIDNYIHDNDNQGILVVNVSSNVIEGNRIIENGVDPGECDNSPKHCHGIYFSNFNCAAANSYNIVKNNIITGHGGAAVQFNGFDNGSCPDSFVGNEVSYNHFENNAVGMNLYYKFDGNDIKHNTFITRTLINTDESTPSFLAIWKSTNNNITHNVFYSTKASFHALEVYDLQSATNNVDYNLWAIERQWWKWDGSWRSDWLNYKTITGWDANGVNAIPYSGMWP